MDSISKQYEVQKEGNPALTQIPRLVSRWFTEHLVWRMKAVTMGLQKTGVREGTTKEKRGSERERTNSTVQTAVDFRLDHNEAMTSKLQGKLCPA